jgi:trigger factor
MTEEKKDNVIDISSLKGKNGFRKDKAPTKREVMEMATEDLKEMTGKMKVLEGVLEMMMRRMQKMTQDSKEANQNLATLCDSLTIRLVAMTRHLYDKKLIDEKEFTAVLMKVNEEMVEAKQAELDMRLGIKNVDREAKEGDVVLVDYCGKLDGAAFAGGTAVRQMVKIGGGGFVDGFDKKLVGIKAGDRTEVELKFPDDYAEKSLAGKITSFSVLCRAVKEAIEQPKPKDEEPPLTA